MKKTTKTATKTTKFAYIREDAWGAYYATNDHEVLARSMNFDEAETLLRKVAPGKTIKVVGEGGTMTLH